MENRAKAAYGRQKRSAKVRGIGWEFTFETWLAWWGNDLERRGVRAWNLQMQRLADAGPYSPTNTRKGTPARNAKTAGAIRRTRATNKAKARVEAALDAAPVCAAPDLLDATESELRHMFKPRTFSHWEY